ncbi:hypothetical protein E4U55_006356 [Claviceps digitariae]|nr:hypothetical protein E4U55_006356 [Claviceps digitariae]
MLATHRDQENLVHSHQQAAIKQQPKTPGARYPKTPGNRGRNDENAPNTVVGKAGLASGVRLGGTGKLAMGKATGGPQPAVTPMENNRSRAPLGNKTTNAKAKNAHTGGVKDVVRDIERTQGKKTSSRKLKKQPVNLQPVKFNVQSDISDGSEAELPKPEYAPPRPTPLPYESDVLPPGGLTFNGLKRENLFKGYYQHFHNPVDENGVSRMEKKFNDEITALMRQAEERNQQEIDAFDWSPEDLAESVTSSFCEVKMDSSSVARSGSSASHRQAPTVCARRAASALAVHSDGQTRKALRSVPITSQATKASLSSIILGTKPVKPVVTRPNNTGNTTGEVASRTTLGYSKGRSASSIVHMRGATKKQVPVRPAPPTHTGSNLTITSARLRETVLGTTEQSRPQFMSIFDDADDNDLPPVRGPLFPSDDEEEEFEFKLTI